MSSAATRASASRTRPTRRTAGDEVGDDLLLDRAMAGDDRALAALLDRYRPFVRMKARSYFLVGADREDVVQEGMVGLYKAIRDYDPAREASFRGFAELCIVRQIITAIKTATRQKHGPLNSYVSLHASAGDGYGDAEVGDVVAGGQDPADSVVQAGEVAAIADHMGHILSELEADVLRRYLGGESYAEIADGLDRHVKSIDNAIQRIKRKLEAYLATREPSA